MRGIHGKEENDITNRQLEFMCRVSLYQRDESFINLIGCEWKFYHQYCASKRCSIVVVGPAVMYHVLFSSRTPV